MSHCSVTSEVSCLLSETCSIDIRHRYWAGSRGFLEEETFNYFSMCSLQIQIPPQTEEVHWLNFSPVEGHFYHRQHEVCSHDALLQLRKVSDWSLKLGSLDRRSVQNILNPLLRLRQACCHPQAVRGEFLPLQKR